MYEIAYVHNGRKYWIGTNYQPNVPILVNSLLSQGYKILCVEVL